jgi:hypothetical protein
LADPLPGFTEGVNETVTVPAVPAVVPAFATADTDVGASGLMALFAG